jgi:hypothetical protein
MRKKGKWRYVVRRNGEGMGREKREEECKNQGKGAKKREDNRKREKNKPR